MYMRTHTIRCAHCRGSHATVADVRQCAAGGALATRRTPVTEDGIYLLDGQVFKVQRAVHGSGRLYAKTLVDGRWEYAPGAMRALAAQDKMTLEQAKQYGRLYGTCCVCGRTLTNEESISAGIGPVCATKF
jgi:hypothetical protein